MPSFQENVSFCRDKLNDEEFFRFQLMKGAHKFIIDNVGRFKGIAVFFLNRNEPKKKRSLPLFVNTGVRWFFDLVTPRGYLVWLVWNHIGVASWKYSSLTQSMTSIDVEDFPIPLHIAASIASRYGAFEYCRYFKYAGENIFEVYWVVLERDGKIVIVENTDSWIGKWGYFLDVNW